MRQPAHALGRRSWRPMLHAARAVPAARRAARLRAICPAQPALRQRLCWLAAGPGAKLQGAAACGLQDCLCLGISSPAAAAFSTMCSAGGHLLGTNSTGKPRAACAKHTNPCRVHAARCCGCLGAPGAPAQLGSHGLVRAPQPANAGLTALGCAAGAGDDALCLPAPGWPAEVWLPELPGGLPARPEAPVAGEHRLLWPGRAPPAAPRAFGAPMCGACSFWRSLTRALRAPAQPGGLLFSTGQPAPLQLAEPRCSCPAGRAGPGAVRGWQPGALCARAQVSNHTITILLGLVFSVINPLVPLVCVLYFCVVYLTERYNMLYSERPIYHAGGKVRAPPSSLAPAQAASHSDLAASAWAPALQTHGCPRSASPACGPCSGIAGLCPACLCTRVRRAGSAPVPLCCARCWLPRRRASPACRADVGPGVHARVRRPGPVPGHHGRPAGHQGQLLGHPGARAAGSWSRRCSAALLGERVAGSGAVCQGGRGVPLRAGAAAAGHHAGHGVQHQQPLPPAHGAHVRARGRGCGHPAAGRPAGARRAGVGGKWSCLQGAPA